jgi:hypothetical protein
MSQKGGKPTFGVRHWCDILKILYGPDDDVLQTQDLKKKLRICGKWLGADQQYLGLRRRIVIRPTRTEPKRTSDPGSGIAAELVENEKSAVWLAGNPVHPTPMIQFGAKVKVSVSPARLSLKPPIAKLSEVLLTRRLVNAGSVSTISKPLKGPVKLISTDITSVESEKLAVLLSIPGFATVPPPLRKANSVGIVAVVLVEFPKPGGTKPLTGSNKFSVLNTPGLTGTNSPPVTDDPISKACACPEITLKKIAMTRIAMHRVPAVNLSMSAISASLP